MVAGDTLVDNSVSGYLASEPITLALTGSPVSARWSLSRPVASGGGCVLGDPDALSTSFTPDAEGFYVATCVVDGTTSYVIRIGVAQLAHVSTIAALRFMPVSDASVPTPALGRTLFCSSDNGGMSAKLPDGSVVIVEVT